MRLATLFLVIAALPLAGCLATKIVTVPVSLAGGVLEGAGKGAFYVGATAVRVTGDALDGPDEMVRITVTYRNGQATRTRDRVVKVRDVEREIGDMSKDGELLGVVVSPAD